METSRESEASEEAASGGPTSGRILVSDVEELTYTVDPWQLRVNQLSSGSLQASFAFAQLHNILLTREHWTKRISGSGFSPPGFMVLSAPCGGPRMSWCGFRLNPDRLIYAFDGEEIDFVAEEYDDHWVMLLPTKLIENQLGEELFALVRTDTRILVCDPQLIGQLTAQVLHTLAVLQANDENTQDPVLLELLEKQLLAAVTRVVLEGHGVLAGQQNTRKRFRAFQRARYLMETNDVHAPLTELAKTLDISRRSLEVGFREEMAMSPQVFSRYVRLNGIRRELLYASPQKHRVTASMYSRGFTELGRTAGYYRELFNESPSDTLRREPPQAGLRLIDAINA